ncbi:MAG: phage tail sheath subtilisin-like domain-containing protein [Solirubrobacteraceae bacterium]|nr:phage tail sheath subtilisin-like domain-containing protein [Solirubrobacteraceae bacterium]
MTSDLNEVVASLPLAELQIGEQESAIAAFVGFAPDGPLDRAVRVASFEEFATAFGDGEQPLAGPYLAGAKLAHAVRGFFRNGGHACWVARAAGTPGTATVRGHLDDGRGLRLFAELDEPTIVAAPDAHGLVTGAEAATLVQRELVRSCERVVGRIALVDLPPDLDPDAALHWRAASHIDSPSAAAYYPWVAVSDPATGATAEVPPSGHAAGLWARVDGRIGPHQAPTAEVVLATDGPVAELRATEQHQLNRAGVNCLRTWPGPELRAWGACTMSSDPELRYLHRQRLVGHLAASIAQGTRWATEEPNASRLHEQLRTVISAFLNQAWRAGALQGDAPSQAFFVRCDEQLNDVATRAGGDVVVEIGLAVRRASDFRVLRIAQHGVPS